ncbi:UNKNOWN [Stylonychia lemnae]|uniref:Uncharacterized protein n=1 Tax=Stylonychia lemnae TaxID=5949 RepID=A0A078A1Y9_STYLE|nr:UNKNOWN [Stylonychia lemnae]|eukprot:CDW76150.1 UNKNOWN [Stylonychia lemnae]
MENKPDNSESKQIQESKQEEVGQIQKLKAKPKQLEEEKKSYELENAQVKIQNAEPLSEKYLMPDQNVDNEDEQQFEVKKESKQKLDDNKVSSDIKEQQPNANKQDELQVGKQKKKEEPDQKQKELLQKQQKEEEKKRDQESQMRQQQIAEKQKGLDIEVRREANQKKNEINNDYQKKIVPYNQQCEKIVQDINILNHILANNALQYAQSITAMDQEPFQQEIRAILQKIVQMEQKLKKECNEFTNIKQECIQRLVNIKIQKINRKNKLEKLLLLLARLRAQVDKLRNGVKLFIKNEVISQFESQINAIFSKEVITDLTSTVFRLSQNQQKYNQKKQIFDIQKFDIKAQQVNKQALVEQLTKEISDISNNIAQKSKEREELNKALQDNQVRYPEHLKSLRETLYNKRNKLQGLQKEFDALLNQLKQFQDQQQQGVILVQQECQQLMQNIEIEKLNLANIQEDIRAQRAKHKQDFENLNDFKKDLQKMPPKNKSPQKSKIKDDTAIFGKFQRFSLIDPSIDENNARQNKKVIKFISQEEFQKEMDALEQQKKESVEKQEDEFKIQKQNEYDQTSQQILNEIIQISQETITLKISNRQQEQENAMQKQILSQTVQQILNTQQEVLQLKNKFSQIKSNPMIQQSSQQCSQFIESVQSLKLIQETQLFENQHKKSMEETKDLLDKKNIGEKQLQKMSQGIKGFGQECQNLMNDWTQQKKLIQTREIATLRDGSKNTFKSFSESQLFPRIERINELLKEAGLRKEEFTKTSTEIKFLKMVVSQLQSNIDKLHTERDQAQRTLKQESQLKLNAQSQYESHQKATNDVLQQLNQEENDIYNQQVNVVREIDNMKQKLVSHNDGTAQNFEVQSKSSEKEILKKQLQLVVQNKNNYEMAFKAKEQNHYFSINEEQLVIDSLQNQIADAQARIQRIYQERGRQ